MLVIASAFDLGKWYADPVIAESLESCSVIPGGVTSTGGLETSAQTRVFFILERAFKLAKNDMAYLMKSER
jgi:hypothetical protein